MAWDTAMSRLLRGIAMSLGLPWVLASVSVPVGLSIALALARSRPRDPWVLTVLGDPWCAFAAFTIAVMGGEGRGAGAGPLSLAVRSGCCGLLCLHRIARALQQRLDSGLSNSKRQ
jgi:hypothetical protein